MSKKNKKPINKVLIAIIALAVVFAIETYAYFSDNPFSFLSKSSEEAEETDSSITEVTAEKRNIENTLSSSGQVSTGLDEKVYLHASYYYDELLVDKDQKISEGENILKYTNGNYLTAPYDCVLTDYDLPEEDAICTTSHYVELQSLHTLTMTLNINESDINKVSVGDTVNITLTSLEETIQGNITTISEVGTYSSSGSYFPSTVTFINKCNIKIGMSATCEIVVESVSDAIAVPTSTIQTSDSGKYVIVVNDDRTTTNTTVETGISDGDYTEIKSGITEGTKVQMQSSDSSSSSSSSRFNSFPGGGSFERPSSSGGSGASSGSGMPSGMPGEGGMPF